MSKIIKVYKAAKTLDNTRVSVYNEVKKYNPYHGPDGRFASANGMGTGGSFALPKNSKNLKNATIPEGVRVFSGEGAKGKRAVTTSIGATIENGKITGGAKPKEEKPETKRDYKERTSIEADEILRKETAKHWNEDWTMEEKKKLYEYTAFSDRFNVKMRNGKESQEADTLANALNKTSLPSDMITYRGTNREGINKFLQLEDSNPEEIYSMKDSIIGKTFSDKGFTSTTTDKNSFFVDKNTEVVYNIKVPKGTKAAYVEPFSHYGETEERLNWKGQIKRGTPVGEEAELLLQRNTSFKIEGMKLSDNKKQIIIDMEVVGQE